MYSKLIMVGNLTKDGETKILTSGTEVYKNSIATSYKYKSNNETKEEVCFLDFNCFGGQATVCAKYLKKGSKVLLEGRLILENWVAQDGSNRSKHSLRVDTMKMLDSKSSQGQQTEARAYQEPEVTYDGVPMVDIDEDSSLPF